MNKNIGIILDDLELSQLNYEVITTINREIAAKSPYDYRIFFNNISGRCLDPMCSTQNISEVYGYDGLIITTNLENTKIALKTFGNVQRVFLNWDLEFVRGKGNFLDNIKIYRDSRLKIISRSNEYAQALKHYANRESDMIMSTINFREMKEIYED